MGDPSLHKSENKTILDPSGRVRLGLSSTTAGSCSNAWPIRVTETTRSDTRPHGLPVGSGTGVATHPVAQLTEQVNPAPFSLQHPHRSLHPRTHSFHTIYDGDGKRIKKYVPSTGELTVFVYDSSGRSVAEYSTIVQTGSNAKTVYLTADHLGSPRINTDEVGNVVARHDYHPFGEEIFTAARTSGLGYNADTVRKQFTGYERDDESNLDFAQARYYNNQHGRFTTVDPYLIVGEIYYEQDQRRANATLNKYISEPQQWNRYSYAINSPLKYTDPLGEKFALPGSPEEQQAALQRLKDVLGDERFALVRQETMDGQIVLSIDNENIPKFQGIGDDDPNKDLSLGLAEILGSSEVVDFVVANTVTGRVLDKNGNFLRNETVDLSSRAVGGGVVVPKENSLSGRMQIVVHPRAGEIATIVMSGATVFSNDGKPLVSTNAMVDAHEIGHVRDRLNSSGPPSIGAKPNSSGPSSVIFENAIRSRIPGNNQIRVKEHH